MGVPAGEGQEGNEGEVDRSKRKKKGDWERAAVEQGGRGGGESEKGEVVGGE